MRASTRPTCSTCTPTPGRPNRTTTDPPDRSRPGRRRRTSRGRRRSTRRPTARGPRSPPTSTTAPAHEPAPSATRSSTAISTPTSPTASGRSCGCTTPRGRHRRDPRRSAGQPVARVARHRRRIGPVAASVPPAKNSPSIDMPGYPRFIPGEFGSRAPQPINGAWQREYDPITQEPRPRRQRGARRRTGDAHRRRQGARPRVARGDAGHQHDRDRRLVHALVRWPDDRADRAPRDGRRRSRRHSRRSRTSTRSSSPVRAPTSIRGRSNWSCGARRPTSRSRPSTRPPERPRPRARPPRLRPRPPRRRSRRLAVDPLITEDTETVDESESTTTTTPAAARRAGRQSPPTTSADTAATSGNCRDHGRREAAGRVHARRPRRSRASRSSSRRNSRPLASSTIRPTSPASR